jgi:hypothetical protein
LSFVVIRVTTVIRVYLRALQNVFAIESSCLDVVCIFENTRAAISVYSDVYCELLRTSAVSNSLCLLAN